MKHNILLNRSLTFVFILSLVFASLVTGCSKTQAPAARVMDAVTVTTVQSAISSLTVNVEYSSKFKSLQEINISPEVAGKVAKLNVDIGSVVEKGQILFQLDTSDLQSTYKQQQANLDYYQANYSKTKDSSIEQQLLTTEQAYNKARITYEDTKSAYERNLNLYSTGAVSKQALIDSETKLKNAEVDLNTARDNLSVMKEKTAPQSIDVASAQVAQAQAGLESASTRLENTSVRSPINGIVSVRGISPGEMVTTATKALTIIDTSALLAEVSLPDKIVEKIQKGQRIQLKINAQNNRVVEGTVDTISPAIDTTTQSYLVKIKVPNADNSLKPGMFVRAILPAEKKDNVLTVPNEAIKIDSGVKYVYTVEDGKVKKKAVTIGLANEKITEILSNLKEGETVITEGQIFLNDGQRVNVAGNNPSTGNPAGNPAGGTGRPQGTGAPTGRPTGTPPAR